MGGIGSMKFKSGDKVRLNEEAKILFPQYKYLKEYFEDKKKATFT
jgi:hypothetical protein